MIESLSDIEALASRCRSEQSKGYIAEAIRCYLANAYRAAIVSTWIAVVYDLIDKIRELAVYGDANAKILEMRYEKYIVQIEQNNSSGVKGALQFEHEILEICRDKLQFFDPQQFVDLTRLRQDRHRCAHPSFQKIGVPYSPSAEQARLHIRNAVVHVLTQPPVQGKAALAELGALVSSAYFPTDTTKAIAQLKNSSLKNGTDVLVRAFIDQLVFGFVSKDNSLFYKPQVYTAINAVSELHPGIAEERLQKQLNKLIRDLPDNDFQGVCGLVAAIDSAWRVLEPTAKDKVVRYIETGPSSEVLRVVEALSPKLVGQEASIEHRINSLSLDELIAAIESHNLRLLAKEPVLRYLSQARSFNSANNIFSKAVQPIFSYLTAKDIERIIRMPKETGADLPGSNGYGLFIENVRKAAILNNATLDLLLKENGAPLLAQDFMTD